MVTVVADLFVCQDCACVMANGEAYDGDGNEISAEIVAAWVANGWNPARLVLTCDHGDGECDAFYWTPCDGCGSTLGGWRHIASELSA